MSHKPEPTNPTPKSKEVQFDLRAKVSEQLDALVEGVSEAAKEAIEAQLEEITSTIKTIEETAEAILNFNLPTIPSFSLPQKSLLTAQFDLRKIISDKLDALSSDSDSDSSFKETLEAQLEGITDTIKSIEEALATALEFFKPDDKPILIPQVEIMKTLLSARAVLSSKLDSLFSNEDSDSEFDINGLIPDLPQINTDAIKEAIESQIAEITEKIKTISEAIEKALEIIHNLVL